MLIAVGAGAGASAGAVLILVPASVTFQCARVRWPDTGFVTLKLTLSQKEAKK